MPDARLPKGSKRAQRTALGLLGSLELLLIRLDAMFQELALGLERFLRAPSQNFRQAARTSRWQLAARSRKLRASHFRALLQCVFTCFHCPRLAGTCCLAASPSLRPASRPQERDSRHAPQEAVAEGLQEPQQHLILHRIPALLLP